MHSVERKHQILSQVKLWYVRRRCVIRVCVCVRSFFCTILSTSSLRSALLATATSSPLPPHTRATWLERHPQQLSSPRAVRLATDAPTASAPCTCEHTAPGRQQQQQHGQARRRLRQQVCGVRPPSARRRWRPSYAVAAPRVSVCGRGGLRGRQLPLRRPAVCHTLPRSPPPLPPLPAPPAIPHASPRSKRASSRPRAARAQAHGLQKQLAQGQRGEPPGRLAAAPVRPAGGGHHRRGHRGPELRAGERVRTVLAWRRQRAPGTWPHWRQALSHTLPHNTSHHLHLPPPQTHTGPRQARHACGGV
jgi:hypothetical protein